VAAQPDLASVIAACQRGDREAFRHLYEAFRHRVFANARHILGDETAAKDVTQCVFVRVWRALPQFDPGGDFANWLYRITVNTCFTERGRARRYTATEPPEGVVGADQERAVYARQVQEALGRLPEAFRAALVLRHVEGLSYEEIAGVLACSVGTVGSRLSRAYEALAKAFEEENPDAMP
jgi:RNA polymerase sigma-70 factor (ECF subfamily)